MFGRGLNNEVAGGNGTQEVDVRVRGVYSPDSIAVERGRPVRLAFFRDGSSPCSETVVFDDFDVRATLTEGVPVDVEITPDEPGSYAFGCEMDMYRGTRRPLNTPMS